MRAAKMDARQFIGGIRSLLSNSEVAILEPEEFLRLTRKKEEVEKNG